jgi:hypothetical protein
MAGVLGRPLLRERLGAEKNEWAPVRGGIAGPFVCPVGRDCLPCHEGLLRYIPIRLQFRMALGLRAPVLRSLSKFSAVLAGVNSCSHLSSRRDPAEQGRWVYPVASCSSPRVVRRTNVRIRCLPSEDIVGRQFLRGEEPCSQTSVRYSTVKMLRQILSCVKLVWVLIPSSCTSLGRDRMAGLTANSRCCPLVNSPDSTR